MEIIAPDDKVLVSTRHTSCDGGKGDLGHPKVYLEIKPGKDFIICPYCSKCFVYSPEKN